MPAPPSRPELGIVVALAAEAASLGAWHLRVGHCVVVRGMWVVLAGPGDERAAAAAGMLVGHGVRVLLSWGVAGGLSPMLAAGDLVMPERIVADGQAWSVDAIWRARLVRALAVHETGARQLWSGAGSITSVVAKRELAARGMAAVDMESVAVARVAAGAALPFVAVKAICDPASRAVPAAALDLLGANGRLRWRGLTGAVRGGPHTWQALNDLRRDFALAQDALRRAARALPLPSAS
jgi:adenosylhomocysteine nucleosidase